MKYKLINRTTGRQNLCVKVTINGFDYYVSEFSNDSGGWHIDMEFLTLENPSRLNVVDQMKKVIATNNPNIDIPKVVDWVEKLALLQYPYPLDIKDKNDKIIQTKGEKPFNHAKIEKYRNAFIIGYNKSQETHSFSEEDMVEFDKWKNEKYKLLHGEYVDTNDYYSIPDLKSVKKYTTKELLQLWKEQQPKIVYYE